MIPHWVRGGKDHAALISGKSRVPLAVSIALGNSVSTKAGGITAPLILIHDFAELEKRKDEVKGKIVFYNHPFKVDFVQVFYAYGEAVPYRAYGASRAAKYGAVGVVVRSMSESTDNFPHTGAMIYNDSFPKIPALAIGLQDADKLAAAVSSQKDLVFLFPPMRMHYQIPSGYNVIGEWRRIRISDTVYYRWRTS